MSFLSNNFRVRWMLILQPAVITFFSYLLFFMVIPNYCKDLAELKMGSDIISNTTKLDNNHGVAIELTNKPYLIWFESKDNKEDWDTLSSPMNINKTIEYHYLPSQLQDSILYNPNQLSINNKIIIPFKDSKKLMGWVLILLIVMTLAACYFLYLAIKNYRENYYEIDKENAKNNKWKLLETWLYGY